jgi:hypothetical protein
MGIDHLLCPSLPGLHQATKSYSYRRHSWLHGHRPFTMPFADLTDTLKSYALFSPTTQADEEPSFPHFDTFSELIQLILNNNIPESIARLLRSNRFIAFHKDPSDPTKLRVIGALITSTYAPDFAQLLLPQGQVGITVKGGIELLIQQHSAQIQLNQYMQQPIDNHQHPQRALLLLNI